MSWLCILTQPGGALAQNAPAVPVGPLPTDVTPIRLREESEMFRPGPSLYLFQKLPANLWFNTSTEINMRFESNVLLTANQPIRDIVFRTFPNMTVGYNFFKNTGIYTNYFMIKDVYGDTAPGTARLTLPTTQSVSLGVRHSRQVGKTNVQFDLQARELWQQSRLHQFDYLPGMLLSRSLTPHTYGFINLQMQMRGGEAFVAPTRELDPFYTVGILRSFGRTTLSVTDTFITNFRDPTFANSVPAHGNDEMIADIELFRPIVKRYPNVVGFVRAEPIWNWHSDRTAGLSGFDFRLYSGIRIAFAKPAVGSIMNQVRKEFKTPPPSPQESPTSPDAPATGPMPNSALPSSDSATIALSEEESFAQLRPALANESIKIKPSHKLTLFEKFKALAHQDDSVSGRSPIMMIQNPMDPFGPQIPTWAPSDYTEADIRKVQRENERFSGLTRSVVKNQKEKEAPSEARVEVKKTEWLHSNFELSKPTEFKTKTVLTMPMLTDADVTLCGND
jgi:hypothetical protein